MNSFNCSKQNILGRTWLYQPAFKKSPFTLRYQSKQKFISNNLEKKQRVQSIQNSKQDKNSPIQASGLILDHRFVDQNEQQPSSNQYNRIITQKENQNFGLSNSQIQALGLVNVDSESEQIDENSLSATSAYRGIPVGDDTRSSNMYSGGYFRQNPTMARRWKTGPGGRARKRGAKRRPPDLASHLLDSRIVYIGMPIVPSVSELVMCELLWLNYYQRKKPVYIYLKTMGSTTPQGQPIAADTHAMVILDTMNYISPKKYTLCLGQTIGNATLILASGTKGCRTSLPNSRIMSLPPRIGRDFGPKEDINIRAREVEIQNIKYMYKMAKATGKDYEVVDKELSRGKYFNPKQAIDYGIIDRIIEKDTRDKMTPEATDYKRIEEIAAQQKAAARPRQEDEMEAASGV